NYLLFLLTNWLTSGSLFCGAAVSGEANNRAFSDRVNELSPQKTQAHDPQRIVVQTPHRYTHPVRWK
ncbi:MAG: hypothetical protein PHP86_03030, partial [Nevskiales bacterium]|nr:hypothetical protein [Nevskiales bacterium]